jgi:hypothetical protein
MTTGERIQRGFTRIGVFFVACCVLYLGAMLLGGLPPLEYVLQPIIVAAVGFIVFWMIGWVISGFFRGANEE